MFAIRFDVFVDICLTRKFNDSFIFDFFLIAITKYRTIIAKIIVTVIPTKSRNNLNQCKQIKTVQFGRGRMGECVWICVAPTMNQIVYDIQYSSNDNKYWSVHFTCQIIANQAEEESSKMVNNILSRGFGSIQSQINSKAIEHIHHWHPTQNSIRMTSFAYQNATNQTCLSITFSYTIMSYTKTSEYTYFWQKNELSTAR